MYCVFDMFCVLFVSLCFMFPISNLLVVFRNVSQELDRKMEQRENYLEPRTIKHDIKIKNLQIN